jgi:hypothetical protein
MKSNAVLITVLGLLMATVAPGHLVHGSQSTGQRLTLKLRPLSEEVCLGSVVPLEMTLTNESESDVKLSQLEIWSNFGIKSVDSNGKKREAGQLVVPGTKEAYERMQNDVVTLSPSSPYITTYKLGLTDPRAFDIPQNYQINSLVQYNGGQNRSTSNFVTVKVIDCKDKSGSNNEHTR